MVRVFSVMAPRRLRLEAWCLGLLLSCLLVSSQQDGVGHQQQQQPNVGRAPPDNRQQGQQPMQNQQQQFNQPQGQQQFNQQPQADSNQVQQAEPLVGNRLLKDYDECKGDIMKFCSKLDLTADMDILLCLQDVGYSEAKAMLSAACENVVWQFKVSLTTDDRFRHATERFCKAEMDSHPMMRQCGNNLEKGYTLTCMIGFMANISRSGPCYQFLYRAEQLAFSDYQLVGSFVTKCGDAIKRLNCGSLTPDSAHAQVRVPHSQGATLECLIRTLVNESKMNPQAAPLIDNDCRHEVMRIAELQAEDFHLDRPLYFACREDREKLCKEVPAGNGKVFECLLAHQHDERMDPHCRQLVSERAGLMGQDYKLAHPLVEGCAVELQQYGCTPQHGRDTPAHFHLSWVLLCLENAVHSSGAKMSEQCTHEMVTHRQMLMTDYHLSPEIMLSCARELDTMCSTGGQLEKEGRSLHCLMSMSADRKFDKQVSTQCTQALKTVLKAADIGQNYHVDRVLYGSCKPLIEGPCAMDAQSETATLQCLMKHIDNHDMTPECEKRLLEVQYFLAREWTLDAELYKACHADAVQRCSALDKWHDQSGSDYRTNPGPQVLACLYRSAYDEEQPLHPECANNVRRLLRTRSVRVNLLPDLEDQCRLALAEFCSTNTKPSEEMMCLQRHFETESFKRDHAKCYDELAKFTALESKDAKLNRALTKACHPVIVTYCQEFANEDIDHGDVMECLVTHKESPEMTNKCRSYVHHFELVSMRDYHFSFKFKQACAQDINDHCKGKTNDKGEIIRCLSEVLFEHRVIGAEADLSKDCKKQLRVAYLEQEKVDFDDTEHMNDADPALMKTCAMEITRYQCNKKGNKFEDIVECLREKFNDLNPNCKALIFNREKIEAVDNELDDELQRMCKPDIARFCAGDPERVLDCLSNSKILRALRPPCQKVVISRLREHAQDDRLRPSLIKACEGEAKQYCPEELKKLNRPEYAEKTLDGVLVACLREKFVQGDNTRLGPACKEELTKVILESEFDLAADPQLFKACKDVIPKHCANAVIPKEGKFESVLECLKADFHTNVITDAQCAKQLARRTQEAMVDIHLDPALHEACAIDIQRLCHDVPPGQSRLITCLMDAFNNVQLHMSKPCRSKLHDRNLLWKKAHEEYKMPMPDSLSGLFSLISDHPQRSSIISWLAVFVCVLFCIGCCCGRVTKRVHRELKNR